MVDEISKLRRNSPFVPFTIHLADGRRFEVPTIDHFLVAGRRAVVLNDHNAIEILPALSMNGITTHADARPEESRE